MTKVKRFIHRNWVLTSSILVVIAYLCAIYLPCIFPPLLCVPTENITKNFSSVSGIAGTLLIIISLNKALERHKEITLIRFLVEKLKSPKNMAVVSFTIPSPQFSVIASVTTPAQSKNYSSLNELRDSLFNEISNSKSELLVHISNVKSEVKEELDDQQEKMSEFESGFKKLSSDINDLAVGNIDRQVFGVCLIIFSCLINLGVM
jgi:hypothetical protein